MSFLSPVKKLFSKKRPISIPRSHKSYKDIQGWHLTNGKSDPAWHGFYRTRYGSFTGKIENLSYPRFYIKNPPKELQHHDHAVCFTDLSTGGWFSVHFKTMPKDLDSGIMEIERTLHESFILAKKTA